MRLVAIMTIAALSQATAQNLLKPNAWVPHNDKAASIVVTASRIEIQPAYDPFVYEWWQWPHVDQGFFAPVPWTYQVHIDAEADTEAYLLIDGLEVRIGPSGGICRLAKTVRLTQGYHFVLAAVSPRREHARGLSMAQPVLRLVVPPTVDASAEMTSSGYVLRLSAPEATVILAAPRRIEPKIELPGWNHGLELEPASLIVLAVGNCSAVRIVLPESLRDGVFLQAVRLSPPGFGSRVWVR